MSRRVLMVAGSYYPQNVAGAHRAATLARYLGESGYQPTVLCPAWTATNSGKLFDPELAGREELCPTVRVPYPLGRWTWHWTPLGGLAEAVWPYRAPPRLGRRMLAAGRRLCRQERFDVVWSTFKPGLCHHVARALAGQFDMHWVADFRDLPDQTRTNWRIRRTVAAEGRFVADADLLITTTDVLAAKLAARHGRQVEVIPNGFDPAEYPDAANSPPPSREKFIVAHFGTVYAHSRPVALLEALDELLAQGDIDANCFSVEMYDPGARVMPAMLAGRPCQKIVRLLPRLSTQQMRGRMFDCSVLLALISPAAGGPAPSKIFEYLPVDRPVLCTPGDRGFAEAVLAQTGAGAVAPTAAEAARLLRGWYRQWQTSGCARREARPEAIALYSRRRQARRLAELFDRLAGEDHASGR